MKTRTHTRHLLAKATAALVVAAFTAPAALAGHADGILPPPDAVDRYIGNLLGGVQTFASEEPIPDAVDRYVRNNSGGSVAALVRTSDRRSSGMIDDWFRDESGAAPAALRTAGEPSVGLVDDWFRDALGGPGFRLEAGTRTASGLVDDWFRD